MTTRFEILFVVCLTVCSFFIPQNLHTQSIQVQPGWNLLSLPLTVPNPTKNTLFPTATSNAYFYQNEYFAKDTLETGIGFWLKFDSSQTFHFTGDTVYEQKIPVRPGWNMVGGLTSPIAIGNIQTMPAGIVKSSFYSYNYRYEETDTLRSGLGYWVKVDQEGVLISDNNPFSFSVTIRDTNNNPIPGLKVSAWNDEGPLSHSQPTLSRIPNVLSTARMKLDIPSECNVSLIVYDLKERPVKTLIDTTMQAGYYTVEWNGHDTLGLLMPSGVYKCKCVASDSANGIILFADSIYMVLQLYGYDYLGYTSASGRYETSDSLRFPNLFDLPPLVKTGENAEVLGEFRFLNTITITITDTAAKRSQVYYETLGYGKNDFMLTWNPSMQIPSLLSIENPALPKKIPCNSDLSNFSQLTIRDAIYNQQTLYFGPYDSTTCDFELPPPSPTFDARFSTGGGLLAMADSGTSKYPILVQNAIYPITISWAMEAYPDLFADLIINYQDPVTMAGNGSVKISSPPDRLVLQLNTTNPYIPDKFRLGQSYPNPFN